MALQIFAVVGEAGEVVGFDVVQGVGQCHVAVAVMVAVGLAVGGDVHQLGPVAVLGKCSGQTVGEILPTIQQALEGDGPGNRAVIEEEVDGPAGRQAKQIGHGRIDAAAADVVPLSAEHAGGPGWPGTGERW